MDKPAGEGASARALLTPAEMFDVNRTALAHGMSIARLLDAAGGGVASAIQARWSKRPVTILCGPGNNGGEGFAAARHLSAGGWPVRVALLAAPEQRSRADEHHWHGEIESLTPSVFDGAGVVVDALFGAGLARPIEGDAAQIIEELKARPLPICAVDVPSGVDGATGAVRGLAAPADITVTFFRKKPGHLLFPGRAVCGTVIVSDIGIVPSVLDRFAPQTFENGPELWIDAFPWPQQEGHKYRRGHALILGGDTTTGASRLTARGAIRSGAGLVTLAAPAAAWPVYASSLTAVMVRKFDGLDGFDALLSDKRRNAVAIGPGAGVDSATRQYVLAALAAKRAVVVDADAITSFAQDPESLFDAVASSCVLTPHEGEFARLFDMTGDKLQRARRAASISKAVVLLKGPDTVIAAPDGRAAINSNAPPQLATGGSGDVLTGFVVGLLAQGLDAFEAASAAVWLHGEAAAAVGLGLIAEDLPEALPAVLQNLRNR